MDTLSSSIPNLQVPKPFNPNHHLKPPLLPHHHHQRHPSSTTKTTATSSISTLPQKDNFTPIIPSYNPQRTPSPSKTSTLSSLKVTPPRASIHRRAASGYAAALLNISQNNGTVLRVEKDVRRLLMAVFRNNNGKVSEFMRDEWVEEREKGEVVIELLERGKFEGHLVGLVKMLVNKGQSVELVKEVLEEFIRVFHQLIGGSVAHAPTPTTRLFMS
ncbi:hypothetical protein SOVF_172390 [Spinacia oleracea]|nr:hypothetical protein SOVF_172390 [Spinacia oleracea]